MLQVMEMLLTFPEEPTYLPLETVLPHIELTGDEELSQPVMATIITMPVWDPSPHLFHFHILIFSTVGPGPWGG